MTNLDEAYEHYKSGRHGRSDLFRIIIDVVKELQARIGAVDEAAVSALEQRMSALETVLGNALSGVAEPAEPTKRGPGRPRKEDANG